RWQASHLSAANRQGYGEAPPRRAVLDGFSSLSRIAGNAAFAGSSLGPLLAGLFLFVLLQFRLQFLVGNGQQTAHYPVESAELIPAHSLVGFLRRHKSF